MTDQTNQGGSSQAASGQLSSSSGAQSQSGQQGQGEQSDASPRTEAQSGQQGNSAPQRPAYVLEAEWDSTAGKIRDDVFGKRVGDLAAFHAEQQIRKNSLPGTPDQYEIKLPPDFKAPEGVSFEFDKNDPALARARELAHGRGIDQETFSDMLGVFAANKIAEHQKLGTARAAELAKLGSAAPQRVEAIETWLKARVGVKADVIAAQLKNYPVAAMVESFEEIIRQFSHQGGASFNQSGRNNDQPDAGKIAGYEGMSFIQRRAAQDAANQKAAAGGR